ncbi:MAG: hypothetical protein GY953_05165, partial [bacterium]|nr:hypothetical protein [bacterium]
FFWHPFMAFIFPLAAAEKLGAASQWVVDLLPAPRRRLVVGGGVAAVVIHGTLTGSPAVALVSTASAALAVVAAAWWWRRGNRHERWILPDLLPDKRQARRIGLLLVAQYAMFIPTWTPEKMPPLVGHVVVWLLYAGFLFLLNSSLEQSRQTAPERAEPLSLPSKRRLALLATGTLALTMIGALI